ncbi:MAG: protein-ADP-ribose hydrolase [Bacteroides sp.]|nr:protein-ADP-ribose hydrolase [Eubacterium sp.]MCM1418127.1 protein-ADP-ribose hydrolase [Roseburia sp.]MCM1462248.1 protein-ADP-ribose hydrolase [Bacteroides sp.]
MDRTEREAYLIRYLCSEEARDGSIPVPEDPEDRFRLFRSLVNVRPPKPIAEGFLTIQDELLKEEIARRGITDIRDLTPIEPHIYLWRGDITTLRCGAIVNAANARMLGCFQPCHSCIDNAIHTFAGVQLRLKCAEIMAAQGGEEPTGSAKITPAYNLPADYVLHTVGPIVSGNLNDRHRAQLESCYRACLELAVRNRVESVAFCCISTGVFGFPREAAARIAVDTVRRFLKEQTIEVIFNVFQQEDHELYRRSLGGADAAKG